MSRKNYYAKEKVVILREHLEKGIPINEFSKKYKIHPNAVYKRKNIWITI
jgi:transposase-like protein